MDREAEFRRLFDAHRGPVHAYFTGRIGDRQAAADLTQDVFLRVWQHLDKLTDMPGDGQRAWVFTVARNLSIDAGRLTRTRADTERALARESARQPQPGSPASVPVIAAERATVVGEAIKELPEDQRVALTMAAAGTMTSGEIAAALGVPAGTVRYRLSMARRALATALDNYDHAGEER
ncbi:MAG TPA: RNA polymerase sigma factor [Trebonia sp.]|nr:RNA polymerase sigma factor [Trebonia sp.]